MTGARRRAAGRSTMETIAMRLLLGLVLTASLLLAGCAGMPPSAPYNPEQACLAVGGLYSRDGRCIAGQF